MSTGQANVRTLAYKEMLAKLPLEIRELAELAFQRFLQNPNHPSLANKLLKKHKHGRHRDGSHSVRITMQYRAIYVRDGATNVWYWIGSHADYDTFVGRT